MLNFSIVFHFLCSVPWAPGFRPHAAGTHEPTNPREINARSKKKVAGLVYNATELLDNLLHNYDSRLRPDFGGNYPWKNIRVYLRKCSFLMLYAYYFVSYMNFLTHS